MKDMEKIIKLLDLSTSDHDAEALNAIRKANEVRKKSGLEWAEIFGHDSNASSISQIIPPVVSRRAPAQYLTVKKMFEEILLRSLTDIQRARIEEIKFDFDLTDSLSGKDINILFNTYNHQYY